jgi:hypothetical protein
MGYDGQGKYDSCVLTSVRKAPRVLAVLGIAGPGAVCDDDLRIADSEPGGGIVRIPRLGLGLGPQSHRPAGQWHHHQQEHPGCGQRALGATVTASGGQVAVICNESGSTTFMSYDGQ